MSLVSRNYDVPAMAGTRDIDVRTAYALQQQGAQLIDVREPHEFAQGHARGASNVPLGQLAARIAAVAQDRVVLLICQSGGRSRSAQDILSRRATLDIRNVQGGTSTWRLAGQPIE
jgi:rhodanese-related sulfurtransferase